MTDRELKESILDLFFGTEQLLDCGSDDDLNDEIMRRLELEYGKLREKREMEENISTFINSGKNILNNLKKRL